MYTTTIPLGEAHELTDEEFFDAFAAATLPVELFRHPDHVRMAWLFLRRMPLTESLAGFAEALRRFATVNGQPDLYHETVTWAFLFLVNERMKTGRSGDSWSKFAERNEDLLQFKDGLFFDYYDIDVLDDPRAKEVFVLPRRGPTER